jgi:hypothetical protein
VTFLPAIGTALGVAAIGYGCYQLAVYASNQINDSENLDDKEKEQKPKYDGRDLGNDPTKCPEGFEWKGKGAPGSKKGNWVHPDTEEWLRPDLEHLDPIKPHWDYGGDFPDRYRLFLDGTWEVK